MGTFLQESIDGYWRDDEIIRFGERQPIDTESFKRLLIPLNTVQCDYSVIVFCGHGACSTNGVVAVQLLIPSRVNSNL